MGFFKAYFSRFEELGFTRGCPIGNFALELFDVNEDARHCLLKWIDFLEKEIEQLLIGERFEPTNAVKLSSFIVASFEGVLLKAKIEKTRKALDEFDYYIFERLLNKMGE